MIASFVPPQTAPSSTRSIVLQQTTHVTDSARGLIPDSEIDTRCRYSEPHRSAVVDLDDGREHPAIEVIETEGIDLHLFETETGRLEGHSIGAQVVGELRDSAIQALLLSIGVYVALPLVAGFLSRRWIIAARGRDWFEEKFLHVLTPVTITALLITLVLLFSFKGEVILSNPLTILWIAIPLFLQTILIFALGYGAAAICPSVAFEAIEDRIAWDKSSADPSTAAHNYLRAASKGVIPKRRADRSVSRLSKQLNSIG